MGGTARSIGVRPASPIRRCAVVRGADVLACPGYRLVAAHARVQRGARWHARACGPRGQNRYGCWFGATWKGYLIALDNLDAVIALIRAADDADIARAGLMEQFGLSEIQAQAILDMRLRALTGGSLTGLAAWGGKSFSQSTCRTSGDDAPAAPTHRDKAAIQLSMSMCFIGSSSTPARGSRPHTTRRCQATS